MKKFGFADMKLIKALTLMLLLPSSDVSGASIPIPYAGRGFSARVSTWRPNAVSAPRAPSSHRNRSRVTSKMAFIEAADALNAVGTFYEQFPYISAFVTCAVKGSAADFLAQKKSKPDTVKRKSSLFKAPRTISRARGGALVSEDNVDLKRNVAFLLYGGIYQGVAQEFIYNRLFPLWFGSGSDVFTVVKKVLFNMSIMAPVLTLPVAYITKALVFQKPLKESMRSYVVDIKYKGLLKKFWALWIPVQCITFSVIPEHMRISFIAFVSFFWLIILSSLS